MTMAVERPYVVMQTGRRTGIPFMTESAARAHIRHEQANRSMQAGTLDNLPDIRYSIVYNGSRVIQSGISINEMLQAKLRALDTFDKDDVLLPITPTTNHLGSQSS